VGGRDRGNIEKSMQKGSSKKNNMSGGDIAL
jgi:hypothetical protein